jgi:hypothetical protein
MNQEARRLRDSAIASLRRAVASFNLPYEEGRHSAVLIALDHAFEKLLKGGLLHQGGEIWEGGDGQTIGFASCVNIAENGIQDDPAISFLKETQATTIRTVNAYRDSAYHHLLDLSEQHLYTVTQAGVTVFDDVLEDVFDDRLAGHMPARVLPVSTKPPQDFALLLDEEFSQVKELLNSRQKNLARAKLHSLEGLERSVQGDHSPPTKDELDTRLDDVLEIDNWTEIFPGVASLNLVTEGTGPNLSIHITKSEGMAVQLEDEDDVPDEAIIGVKRVNELDFYNLGIKEIGDKLPISWQKAKTVAIELDLFEDLKYYKEIDVGAQTHKRYSGHALKQIREALESGEVDPDEAWEEHGW